MSQELMSSKYYEGPSTEEILADQKNATGSRNALSIVRAFFSLILCVAIVGGGGYMVYNAIQAANRPSNASGHGGHPALSMLSFCMGLVDFGWSDRVEKRINSNQWRRHRRYDDLRIQEPVDLGIKEPMINEF